MNSNNQAVNWLIEKAYKHDNGGLSFVGVIPLKMYEQIKSYVKSLQEEDKYIEITQGNTLYNWKEGNYYFAVENSSEIGNLVKSKAYYDRTKVKIHFDCGEL